MPFVRLLQSRTDHPAGAVIEVSADEARRLITDGLAAPAEKPQARKAEAPPAARTTTKAPE